jgi:predicted nucleic acid-binding protein
MILVDSNVIIDVLTQDPVWREWSEGALGDAADRDDVAINPII